jgi:hypothetical protein
VRGLGVLFILAGCTALGLVAEHFVTTYGPKAEDQGFSVSILWRLMVVPDKPEPSTKEFCDENARRQRVADASIFVGLPLAGGLLLLAGILLVRREKVVP